jgi:acetoin:2,6-dichlorophenolindophenol oxidoreductase subunit alpha
MSHEAAGNLSADEQLRLHRQMLLIRKVEEALAAAARAGELPGPVHLYVGQEATAVGVCAHLSDRDWIASTHRGHGHFLAKGGDPRMLVAEVFGRENGICRGRGGSMHVADYSRGIIGANGIVGGGIALTTGAAFAAQLDRQGQVAVAFFGDGAANQGVLMEALNVGALWKLPLVLVCENNGFSEFSPTATVTAGSIARRADPFGVPGQVVDGNDIVAVWQAARSAVARARQGHGPTLLECQTYRLRGHVEYEVTFLSRPYRDEADVERHKAADPIDRHRRRLIEDGIVSNEELAEIDRAVAEEVAEAVAFANAGPWPASDQAASDMFV